MKIFLTILFFAPVLLASEPKAVMFFGDSVTYGYGVDSSQAYPSLIQKKIDAAGLPYRVINAGLSGDTTSAGVDRLRWSLRQKVDVLVLALGGNDGLRGIPPATIQSNLQKMIDFARSKNPQIKIILAGMQMPPNYGQAYTRQFAAVYPALAKKNNIALIPFLLNNVGGIAEMNLPDRIHPTPEGHKIIAETVWKTLYPLLAKEGVKSAFFIIRLA